MSKIKSNERELANKITEWFNDILKHGNYPFKEATCEPGIVVDQTTYFGDLVLWKNRESNEALSYIELKPPFGQKENLVRFKKKAIELDVKYVFTWDFQSLKLFERINNKIELKHTESTPLLKKIHDWLRGDIQASIKIYIRRICDDLTNLFDTGKVTKFIPDKIFFVHLIRNSTQSLLPLFEKFLRESQQQKQNRERIRLYAIQQGIPQSEDKIKVLANHLVYGLVTKIIFYLTVRRYYKDLPDLFDLTHPDLSLHIRKSFEKARQKDWQAVFEEDQIEELGIPKDAFELINKLISELRAYHFGELPEDVIGQLFEEIIDPEIRHNLGQYFTREDLVDLVIAASVQNKNDICCDPTCGSGTFLVRLYDRLRYLSNNRITHEERLNKIWGFDIGKFPAELSTINLFRQDVSNIDNFPRVRCTDIFKVRRGDTFDFPPSSSQSTVSKVNIHLPQFNTIVGNLPFIRQELIEKEEKGHKKKLTSLLAEEYLESYNKLFSIKHINKEHLRTSKQIDHAVKNEWLELNLSGQADIYAYIWLHAIKFLKDDGCMAIITSNAWLDVSYGTMLKKFFLDHFRIKMIIASWAEPWFEDAAVNTIITVIEKENYDSKREENIVHFVKLKKKLSEIFPSDDLRLHADKRWERIDNLIDFIETAENNLETIGITNEITTLDHDDIRVRMLKQQNLRRELGEKKDLAKWGKYLHAPDVYFEILEKCKDKFVPLKQIANVRRGYTTGINEFFYLEKISETKKGIVFCRNSRGWEGEIETKYLKRVIKSPKESDKITIDDTRLRYFIFICNKSKPLLRKSNDIYALKYIEWGENQQTKSRMQWSNVPSVKSRKLWYNIGKQKFPDIIVPAGIADTFKIFDNNSQIMNDKRLYEVYINGREEIKYLLNSTLSFLFIEANSRINLGDGLVDLTVYEVEENQIIKPSLITKSSKTKLKNCYTKLLSRSIKPIFQEVKQRDRIALDTIVFQLLDIDVDEYLPRIYEGLCEMVRERLELAKMRKKQKKQTEKYAFEQIKKSVIEDCFPDGPKIFADDFYDYELPEKDIMRITTSGKQLRYQYFLGHYEIIDASNQNIFNTESELKAEFAIYLAKEEVTQLKIPNDEQIIKLSLQRYKNYVIDLQQQLEADANQKTHDWSVAERIAKEIMDEYGIKIY